jgi:hypothetical protein
MPGPFEVGQHIEGTLVEGAPEAAKLDQGGGDAVRKASMTASIARSLARSGRR